MGQSRDKQLVPEHVAIIMDGNGRWARERNLPRTQGHIEGQEALKRTLRAAGELGVKTLTLYAFSTENWNRPAEEVDALMSLLVRAIEQETETLVENGVSVHTIGDTSRLPQEAQEALVQCKERTAQGTQLKLVVALSYSSRDEIVRAMQAIAHKVSQGELDASSIDEQCISTHLDTAGLPEPDLLIRTGGEIRISNFLLWQAAYTELYFSPVYWPDFSKEHLEEAVETYRRRERRFGLTSEQVAPRP